MISRHQAIFNSVEIKLWKRYYILKLKEKNPNITFEEIDEKVKAEKRKKFKHHDKQVLAEIVNRRNCF